MEGGPLNLGDNLELLSEAGWPTTIPILNWEFQRV